MKRTATCSCGQLSVVCEGSPLFVSACHCKACQRRTGSVFAVNAGFPTSDFEIRGRSNSCTRASDSGRKVKFQFCPECGSTVYWSVDARAEATVVAVGAFADPAFDAPIRTVWTEKKHDWVRMPAGLPAHLKGAMPAAGQPAVEKR
jgi:hypothetical protein